MSSLSQQEIVFEENEVEEYRFFVLELLASCLSFLCLVFSNKVSLFCCGCFSNAPSEPSSCSSPSFSDSASPLVPNLDSENRSVSLSNLDIDDNLRSTFPGPSLERVCVLSSDYSVSEPEITVLEVCESQDLNFDSEPLSVSLSNLNIEDSELIPDSVQLALDGNVRSVFPSPSLKRVCTLSSDFSVSEPEIAVLEACESEDLNVELEPLLVSLLNLNIEDSELIPDSEQLELDDNLRSTIPSPSLERVCAFSSDVRVSEPEVIVLEACESEDLNIESEPLLVSLSNLNTEDSEQIPVSNQLAFDDNLRSTFPSPSLERVSVLSSDFSVSEPEIIVLEACESEDLNVESEPLFWPLEKNFSWDSRETWCCFTMSPREVDQNVGSGCDGFDLSVNKRESPELNSGLEASSIISRRHESNASCSSSATSPRKNCDENTEIETEKTEIKCEYDSSLLEEEFKQDEVSIELLLGLGEFDGHEGVGIEFDQYVFSLDESLS